MQRSRTEITSWRRALESIDSADASGQSISPFCVLLRLDGHEGRESSIEDGSVRARRDKRMTRSRRAPEATTRRSTDAAVRGLTIAHATITPWSRQSGRILSVYA